MNRFRSWFLPALIAFAGLCSVATGRPAGAADIELWTTEVEPSRRRAIEYLMNGFSVLADSVRVRVVAMEENTLVARVIEAAAAGNLPAVIDADSNLLAMLADHDLLDADAAGGIVGETGPPRFFRGPARTFSTADGSGYYAVPFHGWIQAIWYRSDWFKEAGLPPPDDWQSILGAARHFTDPVAGRYGILIGTDMDLYAQQVFTQLARSNGVTALDRIDGPAFSSDAMIETLEFYGKLAEFAPPGPRTWRSRDLYFEGRLAMIFYSTFFMGNLVLPPETRSPAKTADKPTGEAADRRVANLFAKTEMVPVISNRAQGTYVTINGLALTRQRDPAAAAAAKTLVRLLLQPDAYVEWLHMAPGGMLPILRDTVETEPFFRDAKGVFRRLGWNRIRSLVETFDNVDTQDSVDPASILERARISQNKIVPRMIQRAVFGGSPAAEAAAWARAEVEKLLHPTAIPPR